MQKISIIGAGISGLSAAITLAKNGYHVDVFDRQKDSGARFGGDLQGLENWSEKTDVLEDLKSMNIDINFETYPFDYADLTDGHRPLMHATFKKPITYLVKRGPIPGSLDGGLEEQARNLGVSLHYQFHGHPEHPDITATGPIVNDYWAADKGIIFKTSMPDTFMGIINNDVSYKGYAYLLVVKGYGCLCTCIFDDLHRLGENFKAAQLAFEQYVKLDIRDPKPVGGVGSFSMNSIYTHNGSIYIGEAAGLQDFLLGFGMRNAITAGYLAANSIMTGKQFDFLMNKKFFHRKKAGLVNRFVYERFTKNGLPHQLGKVLTKTDPYPYLYSLYNFNWWQRLLYAPAFIYCKKYYPQIWR
ncbi:MAG: NAD(P)-binding protein [Patescibacteria group bacterium]